MGDTDQVLYCPQCRHREVFNVSGTGQNARCFECETEINGVSNIRRASKLAMKEYERELVTRHFQESMDWIFGELNKIANWKEKK